MVERLGQWNLDLHKWCGKRFDGAATMSGHVYGVQMRIKNLFPKAKYFTHCASHCLNLVIASSCTKVPEKRHFSLAFIQNVSDLLAGLTEEKNMNTKLYYTTCLCQHCRTHVGYHVLTQFAR
ncbi:hypothetical protein MAR_015255 [Mya arenaria]|uniref:DUF4371 domain-containing protein n=1 Tax=Mya arenaria TaxID=6604 RepID=A0ABY7FQ17_MYAAR|nr:hypothetical protein MAR_015255 [Mya arenaria]